MEQNSFRIILDKFNQGYAPLANSNSLTGFGNAGMASVMVNADVLSADYLTQGPALSSLGTVTELITFILDKATSDNVSYAIGATKLFKISSTAVASGGSPSWPQVITNCADGESLVDMGGNLYGFYNTSSAGDILKMPLSTEAIDPDWGSEEEVSGGPIGHAALQKAIHPSATKEDLILFGNGRYCGVYTGGSNTLAPTKLDFGIGNEVADVVFHANQWWIAVNYGVSGTNRSYGHIFLYDGSATTAILADETSIGYQRIGFLMPLNGIMYVAYQDLSATDGYKIGYVLGRQLKPLASFSGSLPSFYQKTLFKSTILFISNALVYSCGAVDDNLPIQISQLADGGYSTVGAMAAPFGTPMVASSQSTSYQLAKFGTTFDTTGSWKSIVIPVTNGRMKGMIDTVIVTTKILVGSASATLIIEANQGVSSSSTKTITTTGKTRHIFTDFSLGGIEDCRVAISWSGVSASNDCAIRRIEVIGHYLE